MNIVSEGIRFLFRAERVNKFYKIMDRKNKILLQIRKKQLNDHSWNWTSPGWRGELGTKQQKKGELLNEQYNNVFSTVDPTMIIKYPKDFFGHPLGNTLSDINITREDIIDAIKLSHKNLLEELINFQQYFSNNAARA